MMFGNSVCTMTCPQEGVVCRAVSLALIRCANKEKLERMQERSNLVPLTKTVANGKYNQGAGTVGLW